MVPWRGRNALGWLLLILYPTFLLDATSASSSFHEVLGEVDLGSSYGLSVSSSEPVASETISAVIRGAEAQNPSSLYFLGLLRLYGQGGLPVDPEKAFANIQLAADLGHEEAQMALGLLLVHGHGVEKSAPTALSWLRRAATAGNRESQWLLGRLLYSGESGSAAGEGGQQKSFKEAVRWFRAAAEQGSHQAAYYLGLVHEYGHGTEADLQEAVRWYRQAVEQGDGYAPALYNLGLMQAYGRGLNQDFSRALLLFQEASTKNHAPAMYYMGIMSLYGHGVPVDYQMALLWFDKSAGMEDPAISERAAEAAAELRASLKLAEEENAKLMEAYPAPLAEDVTY